MLPAPLVIDGTAPTEADYVALHYRLWRRQRRTRFYDWLLVAAGGLLVISIGLNVASRGGITDWLPPAFLALGVGYALARGPLVRRQLRQLYARNPALHTPTRFELRPEDLRGQGALGSFECRWPAIRRAVQVGPWLLLYPTESTCYTLDLRRLQPPTTEADVRALLAAQGVQVAG